MNTDRSSITNIWAVNAGNADKQPPTPEKQKKGWVKEQPFHYQFNWWMNRVDTLLSQLEQYGILPWSPQTAYKIGSYCLIPSTGVVWRALAENQNSTPAEGNPDWQVPAGGPVLVSSPTIDGPALVVPSFEFTYVFSAQPLLVDNTIDHFELRLDNTVIPNIPAVGNKAIYSIPIPADGTVGTSIELGVIAVDNNNNASLPTSIQLVYSTSYVKTPTLILPEQDSMVGAQNLMFRTDPFVTIGQGDTHAASQFTISDMDGTLVYDSMETPNLLEHIAVAPALTLGQSYMFKCRHKGTVLGWSEWSKPITATIKMEQIAAPSVISPVANSRIDPNTITFITSSFSTLYGEVDTHSASRYRILDETDAVIYDSGEVTNLLSKTIKLETPLVRGKSYRFQACHKGLVLGWSNWSAPVTVLALPYGRGVRVNNMGTILGNSDGTPFNIRGRKVWLFVADYAHLISGKWLGLTATGLDSLLGSVQIAVGTDKAVSIGEPEEFTESRFVGTQVVSPTLNTDALVPQTWATRAAVMARELKPLGPDHLGCDLPIWEHLFRICIHRDLLQKLDPTTPNVTDWLNFLWAGYDTTKYTGSLICPVYCDSAVNGADKYGVVVYDRNLKIAYPSSSNTNDILWRTNGVAVPVIEIPAD